VPDELGAGEADAPSEGPDYEALLLRAGFNFHVFLAATLGFLRERGVSAESFIAWLAERLAPTWAGLEGHGADAVLNLLLENLASTGYTVDSVSYGALEATAMVDAIPLGLDAERWGELLTPFGVTPAVMHVLFQVFTAPVQAAGATLDLAGLREALRITVRRPPPVQPLPLFLPEDDRSTPGE
jgi:hypothetical protein